MLRMWIRMDKSLSDKSEEKEKRNEKGEGGMMNCACVDRDGRMCIRIRDNIPADKWDIEDEFCDCPCHAEEELQEEEEYITVTHEMAIDAGDPSLEGQKWKW